MYRLNVYIQEGIYQTYTTRYLRIHGVLQEGPYIHDVKQMYVLLGVCINVYVSIDVCINRCMYCMYQ